MTESNNNIPAVNLAVKNALTGDLPIGERFKFEGATFVTLIPFNIYEATTEFFKEEETEEAQAAKCLSILDYLSVKGYARMLETAVQGVLPTYPLSLAPISHVNLLEAITFFKQPAEYPVGALAAILDVLIDYGADSLPAETPMTVREVVTMHRNAGCELASEDETGIKRSKLWERLSDTFATHRQYLAYFNNLEYYVAEVDPLNQQTCTVVSIPKNLDKAFVSKSDMNTYGVLQLHSALHILLNEGKELGAIEQTMEVDISTDSLPCMLKVRFEEKKREELGTMLENNPILGLHLSGEKKLIQVYLTDANGKFPNDEGYNQALIGMQDLPGVTLIK